MASASDVAASHANPVEAPLKLARASITACTLVHAQAAEAHRASVTARARDCTTSHAQLIDVALSKARASVRKVATVHAQKAASHLRRRSASA